MSTLAILQHQVHLTNAHPHPNMPYIHVSSNVAAAGIDTDAFTRALSKSLAESLGVPEQLLLAKISLDSPMLMAKKTDVRLAPLARF